MQHEQEATRQDLDWDPGYPFRWAGLGAAVPGLAAHLLMEPSWSSMLVQVLLFVCVGAIVATLIHQRSDHG